MTNKPLITLQAALLLTLLSLPAAAHEFGGVFGQALPFVAQMSQEDQRTLRERWEQASPEERASLRRKFQDRMMRMVPEQADPRRMDLPMREMWGDSAFGTGYENRRYQDDDRDNRSRDGNDNDRRGRGRR